MSDSRPNTFAAKLQPALRKRLDALDHEPWGREFREAHRTYFNALRSEALVYLDKLARRRFKPNEIKSALSQAFAAQELARAELANIDATDDAEVVATGYDYYSSSERCAAAVAEERASGAYAIIFRRWQEDRRNVTENLTADRGAVVDGYTATKKTVRVNGVRVPVIERVK